jgi:hypothetical protein
MMDRSERNGPARVAAQAGPPIVGSYPPEAFMAADGSKIAVGFFIGPEWLTELLVRIARKGLRR